LHGRANEGEPLINVVIDNKPKMLAGLTKKVRGRVQEIKVLLTQTQSTTGKEAEPTPCLVPLRNVVSRSYSCFKQEGRSQGVLRVWPVEEEGESEGWSVIGQIEEPCLLPRKWADFPLVSWREST
jgi:hypothetical protein